MQIPTYVLLLVILDELCRQVSSLQLLSDIRTPSFLVDLQFLQRQLRDPSAPVPTLRISGHGGDGDCRLTPVDVSTGCPHSFDDGLEPFGALDPGLPPGLFYLHSRVVPGGAADDWDDDDRRDRLWVPLDLPRGAAMRATPVLGLNNHHVGGYYWARSAGAGAAMEAPGVRLVVALDAPPALTWAGAAGDDGSFVDCNSNDGKRSEWVPFLKPGDQVQLVPHDPLAALTELRGHIYGVSGRGRPLGSEPAVVCRWEVNLC